MKKELQAGLRFQFKYIVPENKTVPFLYPEAAEFQQMPSVFATGFMVGLFEWACIQAVNPYIEWPDMQTVGTGINVSHIAPTPPGLTINTLVTLTVVEGRKLSFSVLADDGIDKISEGTHERFIINATRFNDKVTAKIP